MPEVLLLDANGVAAALGVSRSVAYRLMAAGALPVVRIGRRVSVPVEALRAWVAERSVVPGRQKQAASA
jgi:excisionase family DNA binding protein